MEREEKDEYRTLKSASTVQIYKDRGSKFLGYAFPVSGKEEVEEILNQLKTEHSKARHWCYAWQTGVDQPYFRYSDDGEPSNTAGRPIYGQIQSFELTDVLLVVVRYFGGTKLGVGGLINAYRSAAKQALENAEIIKKRIQDILQLKFEYAQLDRIMRVIKDEDLDILDQKMELDCVFQVGVRRARTERVARIFEELRCSGVKKIS